MRKSRTGFILGLTGGLVALGAGAYYCLVGSIFSDLGGNATLFTILSWLMFAGAIVSIVGACLCFKKARVGGLLLFLGALMTCALTVYTIILTETFTASVITSLIFSLLPSVAILIASIFAVCAKKQKKLRYRG